MTKATNKPGSPPLGPLGPFCPFYLAGTFEVEGLDAEGNLLWRDRLRNGITTPALTDLLSVYFASGTQKPSWYVGLIDATGYTDDGIQPDDTMSSHAGWTEFTGYSASTRPAWSPTISGGLASNPTRITLTMTAPARIKGLFLASNSTKGGTSGVLWSTGLFAATRSLEINQVQRLIYTLRAAGGG